MNARDVMTRPATTLRADASLGEAIELMLGRGISGVPIVDRYGRLVGVLTEGDLLRRVEVGTDDRHRSGWWTFLRGRGVNAGEYVRTHSRRVEDLMTRKAITVTEGTPLEEVVELMERKRIKRLPVVQGDEVVGMVSRADLLRAIGAELSSVARSGDDDAKTLGRLHAELDQQPWFTARDVSISVKDGIVTLEGIVTDERMRAALRVAAENVSGAIKVEDEIVVLEPNTGLVSAGV